MPAWKDHLLTDDGILDVCGGFVHVSAGRIHLCHSSVTDFLTRPADQWAKGDEVGFFRIVPPEDHRLMGFACPDYLAVVDWGYPLHDNSFMALSQAYSFLSYACRHLVFHILQAKIADVLDVERVTRFLESTTFCKWIEYLVVHLLHDNAAVLEQGVGFIEFEQWYDSATCQGRTSELVTDRLAGELERRSRAYGNEDPRTASWESIYFLFRYLVPSATVISPPPPPPHPPAANGGGTEGQREAGVPLHAFEPTRLRRIAPSRQVSLPPALTFAAGHYSAAAYGALLLKSPAWVTNTVLSLDASKLHLQIMLSAAERLPVLIVLLVSISYSRRGCHDVAAQLCAIAAKRTEGRRNFEEAAALGYLGDLMTQSEDETRAFDCYSRAADITKGLPRSLPNDLLRIAVTRQVVLSSVPSSDVATEAAQRLADFLSACGPASGRGRRWEQLVRQTGFWTKFRGAAFQTIIQECHARKVNEQALTICQQALDSLQEVGALSSEEAG